MNQARAMKQVMATPAQIFAMFITLLPRDADDDERTYSYTDSVTHRQFQVRRSEGEAGHRFFLEEIKPNGRLCKYKNGKLITCWDDNRIPDAEHRVGPNGLMAEVRKLGINPEDMVFVGGGYGVGTIFWRSLEECAEAIAESISGNHRYQYFRPLSEAEREELNRNTAESSKSYWAAEAAAANAAQADKGLFKGCYTMMGNPVADEHKQAILGYLNAPTEPAWLDIRGYCIVGGTTLWQAWCAADEKAPRSGSTGFPDPETLRQAIRQAVDDNLEKIKERL